MRDATKGTKAQALVWLLTALFCTPSLLVTRVHARPLAADMAASPHLTEAQAVSIAGLFCRRIGSPVSAPGYAQYPVPSNRHVEEPHWQPRWWVLFPGQAEVEVVDASGLVSFYSNEGFSHEVFDRKGQPSGTQLSQQEARQRAAVALRAAGQFGEVKFLKADLDQNGSPGEFGSGTWYVLWRRVFQGLTYRNQHAAVSVSADTGEVTGMAVMFPSAPPNTTAVAGRAVIGEAAVSAAQADETVQDLLQRAGIRGATLQKVEEQLIQPNTFWQPGGDVHSLSPEVRHAFNYRLSTIGETYEVWVDAQSGEVIGGEATGRKSAQEAPRPLGPLKAVLDGAQEVRIYRFGSTRPLAVLSLQSQPQMFHLLKSHARFFKRDTQSFTRFTLECVGSGGRAVQFGYFARSGQFSLNDLCGQVPDAVKAWIQEKIDDTPTTPKK